MVGETRRAASADGARPPIRLYFARFSRHQRPQWLARSAELLNAAELERVAAIVDPDTRAQHAVGRALLRLAGAREAGFRPSEVTVAVTDTGKPWLPDVPDLHVNVSHTRRAVVVAAAPSAPVGVDIEHPAAAVHPRRVAQRLFAGAEVGALRRLSEDRLADWFSSAWTIKEAVAKALDVGVITALSGVVVVDTADAGLRLAAVRCGPPAESWTLHQLEAPGGSEKIAVAAPTPGLALAPISLVGLAQLARAGDAHGATARRCSGSAPRRARM